MFQNHFHAPIPSLSGAAHAAARQET